MRTFADKTGSEWAIDLTIGSIIRVKDLSDGRLDLLRPEKPIEHEDLGRTSLQAVVLLDLPTLAEVLWYLVAPQCQAKGVTHEDFAERLSGDVLIKARDKLAEEWRDFFQSSQRPDRATALEKMRAWIEAAHSEMAKTVQAAEADFAELDRNVRARMKSTLTTSFGKLREFSASTRDPSPGGS